MCYDNLWALTLREDYIYIQIERVWQQGAEEENKWA